MAGFLLRTATIACLAIFLALPVTYSQEIPVPIPVTEAASESETPIDMGENPTGCESRCRTRCKEDPLECEFIADQIPVGCENVEKNCIDSCGSICECVSTCEESCHGHICSETCMESCYREQRNPSRDEGESNDPQEPTLVPGETLGQNPVRYLQEDDGSNTDAPTN